MITQACISAERRSEGLAAASRARRPDLLELAEDIAASCHVEVLEAPTAATLMVQLQSAVGEHCLGEVVVTYASVRVDSHNGWACVSGWDEEGALAAALCDAIADARVDALAEASLAAEADGRASQSHIVAATALALA